MTINLKFEIFEFQLKSKLKIEQDKVAFLEQSDLFVMPSVVYKKSIEGFGIGYIEAASYGTASIGGIFGGENDAIMKGKTGYLCDGNELNSLYDILLKCFENNHFEELGSYAQKVRKIKDEIQRQERRLSYQKKKDQ